jgi:type I restriction enzyme, R subunit
LKKVTPSAIYAKTHYVIIDAIGVTKSLKTSSQPLITKPSIPLKDLAMSIVMGARDQDTVGSLAGRLARLNKQLDEKDQQRIKQQSGGLELGRIINNLLTAIDPDQIEAKAKELSSSSSEPSEAICQQAQEILVSQAANIFTGNMIDLLENIRRDKEQTIDHDNLDTVIHSGWDGDAKENAQNLIKEFQEYLELHRDNIEALTIFYSQPHRRREVTYEMIHEVLEKLRQDKPKLAPFRIWMAYAHLEEYRGSQPANELTAIIALIRRVSQIDEKLSNYSEIVRKNFQSWIMKRHKGHGEKFNDEQMAWLRMIRDHIITSFHVEKSDLDMAPFDSKGGLGKMYQLFEGRFESLILELNEALVI